MKSMFYCRTTFAILVAIAALALFAAAPEAADCVDTACNSGDKLTTTGAHTLRWTGQGATDGVLGSTQCDAASTPYLHWIFTVGGGGSITDDVDEPTLILGGSGSGSFENVAGPGAINFNTPYYVPDSNLTAHVEFNALNIVNGAWNLVISHGCSVPPPPPVGSLTACKYYDFNANGVNNSESSLAGWPMTIDPVDGASESATKLTNNEGCVTWTTLDPGTYTVTEGVPNEDNWVNSDPGDGTFAKSASVVQDKTSKVEFGNYCTEPSGGKTPGFWSNKNGQALIDENDLTALRALDLVDASGTAFDPSTKDQVKTWLLASDAVNMAYKLSVHLAAMTLNIREVYVDGTSFDLCSDQTVNELVSAAAAALEADGYTPAGDPNRSTQEALKNCLDALNNNADVVPSTHCPYTFPY